MWITYGIAVFCAIIPVFWSKIRNKIVGIGSLFVFRWSLFVVRFCWNSLISIYLIVLYIKKMQISTTYSLTYNVNNFLQRWHFQISISIFEKIIYLNMKRFLTLLVKTISEKSYIQLMVTTILGAILCSLLFIYLSNH